MSVGDKVAGIAATGADVLPVYRYLGARLAAEEVIRRAVAQTAEQTQAAASAHPSSVEVKYTRSSNDLPDAPKPVAKRGGCLPFLLLLMAAGLGPLWWSL